MDFQKVVQRRRMARNFSSEPVAPPILERILANGLRAPSAGFTQGWAFLLLEGPVETGRYWDAVLPEPARDSFPWPGLLNAPALIVALSHPRAYADRYREADKRRSRFEAWTVPYWHVDTAFAALLMLLTAEDAGLGALFFAVADIPAFRAAFDVPEEYEPIGAIAVGYPLAGRRSSSLRRGRRPLSAVVHRGHW